MERDFYRNILIATDGSENTQRAISYGIEIAKLSGAAVYALYVVNTSPIISEYWTIGKKNVYEIIRSEGEKAVFEVKKIGEASGVEVKEVVLDGYPSNAIIDFADNNNIDLIVMGTLGKTGLDKLLIGSVAEKVVRGSKVPVMVVRGEEQS
ncbi:MULTISPECIES: universal stress protein [Methanosarcina]|uniref:Universal stress protein n=3 Tax=Methanosarcina barkeri TaxID=2208 RepID=A0A0E3LNG5_METBA|nr:MULTISPECIES: universal stress protein [Methanosarcina]AKB54731.1 Universal stress protein [Methanosarcina barkeri MS]AKB57188.1 Universal stress protein [Methanosarcina barkeri 227]AKJ37749.1 universal stress protein UspA6 [Methanosarcina barkeri CM1]OEC93710.1 universal stress protein [Methanosarcina sp. A14]